MFRISTNRLSEQVECIVDGDLSIDCTCAIERLCLEARRAAEPVTIRLRDVQTVSQTGRDFLIGLIRAGTRVVGSGLYTSYLVEECRRNAASSHRTA